MQIFGNYKGTNYVFDAEPSDALEGLRSAVSVQIGINVSQIILTFGSIILDDDTKTLSEYNIFRNSTVFVTVSSNDQSFNVCVAIVALLLLLII